MRVFTKLGLSLLAVMISASVIWAQSFNEYGPKHPYNVIASDAQFDLQFDYPVGVGGGEAGIETDGSYIYTTKWNGGDFYKYGMDGTYIETFTCGSAASVRDLAYDGTYFYGAAANTSLFQMDFSSQTLVSTITAPTDCRAIAYNEDDGYFYANNWSSDIVVFDMSGTQVNSFAVGASGASYYGFAYDGYSSGAPYLWGYSQTGATQNDLIQMQLPEGTETGLTFDVGSVAVVGTGIAGGLAISNEFVTGYYTIFGTAQNIDIWGLELVQSGALPTNDVGIQSIVSPSSGMGLGNAEAVTVTVKNFGTDPQSNFEVSYSLDGGTPVTETFTGTINSGESADHTFATTVDLSAYGSYTFDACTNLAGDETPDNDCKTKTVENSEPAYCDATTGIEDEYIANVLCGDIDNSSAWQGGVADYTDQSTSIDAGGSVDIVVTNGNAWSSDKVTVWVDWNNDFVFDQGGAEEFVLENVGGTGESFTGAIVAPADAMAGDHRMRVRMTYSSDPEPCGNSSYGEVEDYTMTVGGGSGALFADDFDSYTAGQQLACQNPDDWTTWSIDPCNATEDAYISDTYAHSAPNSVNIVNDNDQVKKFGDEGAYLASGVYKISFYMYIPTGNDAYWNTMSDFGANNAWAMEAYYDNGTGTLNAAGNATATTFTYPYDTWMYNELVVDLDNDMAQFYIDGTMIFEWQWSLGGGLVQIAANDFYGYEQTNPCSFYFDDYAIEEITVPPVLDPPTNLAATVNGNDVTLTWDAPGGGGGTGEWIQWDDGVNSDNGIGMTGGGTFYAASHWEPADLTAYDGQYLTKISFFPYTNAVASTFTLKVWSGENAGTLLLSQDVASYTAGEWNEVTLDTPVMIDASQEFWFGYETTNPDGENPAGVDAGPAIQYKGDMISFDASAWVSMSADYNLDFNWNLAGYVEGVTDATVAIPMVKNSVSNPSSGTLAVATGLAGINKKFNPSSSKGLTGYNVYRDGGMIDYTTDTTYTDMGLEVGSYDYYVTAVYDEGESDPSNTVTAEVTGSATVIFADDFEAYNVGEQVACQNPDNWTTWSEDPCNATEDPYVSDAFAHSGTNSANIVNDNDLVKVIPNYTSGKYEISFYMYVPTGADGYWNTLQDFAGANSQWGMQVYFGLDAAGAGSVDAGALGAGSFTFNYDTWIFNDLIVDLNADWAQYYVDGDLIVEWQWSTGSFGTGTLNQLGGNDFYGWNAGVNANSNYYFDDYVLQELPTPQLDPPTNVMAEVYDDVNVHVTWDAPGGGGPTGSILCVDRDGSSEVGGIGFTDDWQYIEPALIANGFTYDYYEVEDINTQDGPDLATMQQYDIIIWFTGEAWTGGQTMTDVDQANLADYLAGGGNLLLSAQDYLYDKYPSAGNFSAGQFPYDYLGVASVAQDTWSIQSPATASVSGVAGSFADGLSFTVQDIYTTAKEGLYIDQITSLDQDLLEVTDPTPTGNTACQYSGANFKTAFTTTSIAAIVEADALTSLLGDAVNWLSPGSKDLTGYNVYRNGEMIATVTGTSFDDEGLEAGDYDYCVSAVYSDGESVQACAPTVTIEEQVNCENFDALTVGGYVAEQLGDPWTTWSGAPGGPEDAIVSDDYSVSASNSFTVNAATTDCIYKFGNDPIATGQWLYSNNIYVPSGFSGYFNVQSDPTPGVAWVMEIFFDDGGAGHFAIDGTNTDFTYAQDTWINVSVDFDLDNGVAEVMFDGTSVHMFTTANTIGGIDFFGSDSGGAPGAYYDDVCFGAGYEIPLPPGPTNLTAESLNGVDIELNWDAPATGAWIEWDDGVNSDNGIGLTGGGTFYTASHWEPADLANYNGMYLTKISYYHYDNAATATFVLKVWSGANAGTLLLSQDVSGSVPAQWNEITLDTPVQIDASQELWFGYEVTHGDGENPAGVDAGPAVQYKGDMLSTDASTWVSISAEYNLDFNWNLMAYVSVDADGKSVATPLNKESVAYPQGTVEVASGFAGGTTKFAPAQSKGVTSYNVYHKYDTDPYTFLANTTETSYTHMGPLNNGVHCYYVTAVYDNGLESEGSNEACETIIGVDEYLADAISVYPNPATDVVNVKSDVQINSVKVYNYAGQLIVNEDVNAMMYHLNTSQYQSGIYFFQIETNEGTISKRIIIQ